MYEKSLVTLGLAALVTLTLAAPARAQSLDNSQGAIEIEEAPEGATPKTPPKNRPVGRKAAEKYMAPKNPGAAPASSSGSGFTGGANAHYMAVHVGGYITDGAYKWGAADSVDDVGKWNLGVTYRVGEWTNSMDLLIRVDFSNFALPDGKANKLSFLPVLTFPDASSRFPLYFGAGLGLGVFVNQLSNESPLALDYQLLAGVRFFDLFRNTGFFLEAGLKNHLLLTSDGQFNGTFIAVGSVFTF
jgi:hypothetical protein